MNNQKKSNAKQAKKAIAAVERLVAKNGKPGQGQKKRNRKQAQAAQTLQVQRQKKVAIPRSVGGYNALTERWRRALLDPFSPDSVGVVAAGDFFVRNAVPYTIKRNIQLTSGVNSSGTVLIHPSLNCMAWNPDTNITLGGNGNYKLYCSSTASPVTNPSTSPRPFSPAQLSSSAVGLSLPQMNGLFSKYRIVAWGVRFRFNGTVTNSSGKCISVAVPYDGYLPAGTYNTTTPGIAIDTPYTSGANYADDLDTFVYAAHPDSSLSHRRHVASALVNDMNLPVNFQGTNSPTIPSGTVLGLPHSETFMINETVGKVFEMQPRPSSCELWKWRDTGMSGTAANIGTTTEQIFLNAGTDSFPAAINVYYVTGASAASINMVDTDCDSSSIRAMGFESCALCFDGLTAGQQFGDLELIYHIEAVPNTQAGTVVPGCNPSGAMVEKRPRQVASRAVADDMLMAVSAVPNQMMLSAAQALSGVARAAALGPAAGAGKLLMNLTQAFV